MTSPFDHTEKTRKQKLFEFFAVIALFSLSFTLCLGPGRAADLLEDDEEYFKGFFEEEEPYSEEPLNDISVYLDYETLTSLAPNETELLLLEAAIEACPNGLKDSVTDLLALIRLEKEMGVDEWGRGILLGVFCIESSYRSVSKDGGRIYGDFRNGVAMAHGPFQLWPVNRKYCGDTGRDAHDLIWAGRCWVRLVERAAKKAELKCPRSTWRTAEAAVSNIARYRWSCHLHSKHWAVAEKINEAFWASKRKI